MRISDWSSDVCSSDLITLLDMTAGQVARGRQHQHKAPRRTGGEPQLGGALALDRQLLFGLGDGELADLTLDPISGQFGIGLGLQFVAAPAKLRHFGLLRRMPRLDDQFAGPTTPPFRVLTADTAPALPGPPPPPVA